MNNEYNIKKRQAAIKLSLGSASVILSVAISFSLAYLSIGDIHDLYLILIMIVIASSLYYGIDSVLSAAMLRMELKGPNVEVIAQLKEALVVNPDVKLLMPVSIFGTNWKYEIEKFAADTGIEIKITDDETTFIVNPNRYIKVPSI